MIVSTRRCPAFFSFLRFARIRASAQETWSSLRWDSPLPMARAGSTTARLERARAHGARRTCMLLPLPIAARAVLRQPYSLQLCYVTLKGTDPDVGPGRLPWDAPRRAPRPAICNSHQTRSTHPLVRRYDDRRAACPPELCRVPLPLWRKCPASSIGLQRRQASQPLGTRCLSRRGCRLANASRRDITSLFGIKLKLVVRESPPHMDYSMPVHYSVRWMQLALSRPYPVPGRRPCRRVT